MENNALLDVLYEEYLKKIFKSRSELLNYLFTKEICIKNKCSSPSECGKEMRGQKEHLLKYIIIEESLFKKKLSEGHSKYMTLMTCEVLGSIVEHTVQYYNQYMEEKIFFENRKFDSNSQDSYKAVEFFNKLYALSQNSFDKRSIANFWYTILYIHYTRELKISVIGNSRSDISIKLDILGIDKNLLDDYITNVILDAGVSGLAGMRSIIRFANQAEKTPNPFALFEAGEIYYYDRLESGIPDFNKAHEYYLKAARFNFPLALWSLGYMYQKYGEKDSITGNIINFSLDPDLENDESKRYKKALDYFKKACVGECGAAYNSIGNYYALKYNLLRKFWVELYPFEKNNETIDTQNIMKCQEYYYKKSAELKDANGTFNHYRLLIKKILNGERISDYSEKILQYLNYLVELEYPAGCNSLALHLIHKTELDEAKKHICEKNFTKARGLFKLAADKKGAEHYPWAQFNYALYFLKERDRDYDKAIEYFELGTETGDDLCYIKCCKEIFNCLVLRNLNNSDVDYFIGKYSGPIAEIIEKLKKEDNRNSPVWINLEELGKKMLLSPKPNEWILRYMEIKND